LILFFSAASISSRIPFMAGASACAAILSCQMFHNFNTLLGSAAGSKLQA